MKRIKSVKAAGQDYISVEVWRRPRERTVDVFFTRLLNVILESEEMPDEWRIVLVQTSKNNDDLQSCGN